jgi:hypothetical protein
VVLARAVILLGLVGCSKSLFDDGGGGGGGDDDNPLACPDPCVANAAGDFDGTPAPTHWRFVEDSRDRRWAEMTASGDGVVGADSANAIATCAAHPDAAACAALPGALLVSSSGSTSGADPAVEFTAPSNQVLALAVHVFVPDGSADQVIRLYRNSREDVLATSTATAGTTLDMPITVDALAGDRILVAMAPSGAGAADVGVHFFVTDAAMTFPQSCQLAVSFDSPSGTGVANACGMPFVNNDYNAGTMIPAALTGGPFAEQHQGAQIAMNTYYTGGDLLDKSGDVTIQMWVRLDMLDGVDAGFAFSDYDLDNAGGVAVVFYDNAGTQFEVSTCISPSPLDFTGDHVAYAADGMWHFIRVVHTNGTVSTCIDGTRAMRFPLAAGKLASTFKPYLGRDVVWTPSGAFFAGALDDVRVFKGALPCE